MGFGNAICINGQFFGAQVLGLLTIFARYCDAGTGYFDGDSAEYPEGYFPFEESPARVPPKVRRPPYAQADVDCPGNSRLD